MNAFHLHAPVAPFVAVLLAFSGALGVAGSVAGCASAQPPPVEQADDPEERRGPSGIEGVVRDIASGTPLAFVAIRAAPLGAEASAEGAENRESAAADSTAPGTTGATAAGATSDTSDADGAFRITLAPGRYQVTATYGTLSKILPDVAVVADRHTSVFIDIDSRPPEAAPGETEGEAARLGEIVGRVVESTTGEPFEGAVVSATTPALRDALTAISDPEGNYRLPGLLPGRYDLSVYYQLVGRGAIEMRRTDVEVRAGIRTPQSFEIDLRVEY